jgi:hypothetical protein
LAGGFFYLPLFRLFPGARGGAWRPLL